MNAHSKKLAELRKKKQQESETIHEEKEMVLNGAVLKCPYTQAPGKLIVTSNSLKLQDQLWATKADDQNMANLQFPSTCGHPKFAGKTPPPCMGVINLINGWQNVGNPYIQNNHALIKASFIMCDPLPNVRVAVPMPAIPIVENEKEEERKKGEIIRVYISNYQEV